MHSIAYLHFNEKIFREDLIRSSLRESLELRDKYFTRINPD